MPKFKENFNDIDKLVPADPDFVKAVQSYVDRFKKAAEEIRVQLTVHDEEYQNLLLQKDLMDLYLYGNEKTALSQHLNQLIKIQGRLKGSKEEFLNDVVGMIGALKKQKQSYEEYKIINTDRFDLMMLCGTQVQGSCQRIDGEPTLNKCLLAYLLDGKIRLIAIVDKEGNVVARSILRLLYDETNNCPCLMQERVYSNFLDESLTTALDKFAQDQAESLGLALYRVDDTDDASLVSFRSPAPWEYVDSAGGVYANGRYIITKASRLMR